MPRKLLHIQLLPLLSGVQNFSLHLLSALPASEYEIYVASKPGGEFVTAVKNAGYHYVPMRFMKRNINPWDILAFLDLIRIIKIHHIDIVHTNSSKPGLFGRLAAWICNVPLIIHTAHGTAFHYGQSPLVYRCYELSELFGNRFCHKTVFVNNSGREYCIEHGIIAEQKAMTIYNALNPALQQRLEAIAAQRSFFADGMITIGSLLRFSDPKNIITIVSAACHVCRIKPNLRFILVGDGEHLALCRTIVHSFGLNQRIILPGWDSNPEPWLAKFDLFILYSLWEALPMSIIEAMFSGLPVIGSDVPGICELVDDSTGYIVPKDDLVLLQETLLYIADHADEIPDKSLRARESIKTKCSFSEMIRAYSDIYANVEGVLLS